MRCPLEPRSRLVARDQGHDPRAPTWRVSAGPAARLGTACVGPTSAARATVARSLTGANARGRLGLQSGKQRTSESPSATRYRHVDTCCLIAWPRCDLFRARGLRRATSNTKSEQGRTTPDTAHERFRGKCRVSARRSQQALGLFANRSFVSFALLLSPIAQP